MSYFAGVKLIDEAGAAYGVKHISNKPRVSAMPYLYDIAEGNVSGHVPWSKVGYNPAVGVTEEDIWSAGGVYVFPPAAMQMEVVGGANDVGTVLHSGTADAGGTATTLVKAGENFLTTTVAGDVVILDKSGAVPEWGYITAVDSDTQITCAGGFSSGGSGAGRAYEIIDSSATTGAQAVLISYLNGSYVEDTEIVILNGATPVDTVQTDLFRINAFRVIAAGSLHAAGTALELRETDGAPLYSYISAGYTRARNSAYTVPAGKTLYITMWHVGAATPNDTKVQTCRVFTRANREPATGFLTLAGGLFYPYTELLVTNAQDGIEFPLPTKLPAGTDLKVSAIGLTGFSGPVTSVLRGWLE